MNNNNNNDDGENKDGLDILLIQDFSTGRWVLNWYLEMESVSGCMRSSCGGSFIIERVVSADACLCLLTDDDCFRGRTGIGEVLRREIRRISKTCWNMDSFYTVTGDDIVALPCTSK